MADVFDRIASVLLIAHVDIEALHAFEYLPGFDTTNGGFDQFLNLGEVQTVPCDGLAVRAHHDLR